MEYIINNNWGGFEIPEEICKKLSVFGMMMTTKLGQIQISLNG